MREIDVDSATVCRLAIATYGESNQRDMAIEECSELIQALCKLRRCPSAPVMANVLEEMADVSIMLEQLEIMYGSYADIRDAKVQRLLDRIGEHRA